MENRIRIESSGLDLEMAHSMGYRALSPFFNHTSRENAKTSPGSGGSFQPRLARAKAVPDTF